MKVDRLVSIIMVLLDKQRIGAQELATMFEVSLRTIYRDIDSINRAGIPVLSIPGVGGGFEIMQEYKLGSKVFTTADLSAILMGLSSLSSMIRGDDLMHALAKVRSFIPPNTVKEITLQANQIQIDLTPWMGNRNIPANLKLIRTALQESRLVSFAYIDHQGNRTSRTAEPYRLILKNSHWYWQGYCQIRNDLRLFKLSRTANLQILDQSFTPREITEPQLDCSEMVKSLQTNITLRIHKSVMDRVLEYCTYEHFTPDGQEHYLVSFPFIENDYHYDILLSFGTSCECLEPHHIRTEMIRRIYSMVALYETEIDQ